MRGTQMADVRWFATDQTDTTPAEYTRVAIGGGDVAAMLADAVKVISKRMFCMGTTFELGAVTDAVWEGSRLRIEIVDKNNALFTDPVAGRAICEDAAIVARYGRKSGVDVEIRTVAPLEMRRFERHQRDAVAAVAEVMSR